MKVHLLVKLTGLRLSDPNKNALVSNVWWLGWAGCKTCRRKGWQTVMFLYDEHNKLPILGDGIWRDSVYCHKALHIQTDTIPGKRIPTNHTHGFTLGRLATDTIDCHALICSTFVAASSSLTGQLSKTQSTSLSVHKSHFIFTLPTAFWTFNRSSSSVLLLPLFAPQPQNSITLLSRILKLGNVLHFCGFSQQWSHIYS